MRCRVSDASLVERSRQGDLEAYTGLVRRYQRVAARVAAAVGAPDPEDAVQEAFVKAYRALPRFRAGSEFRPWLLRIVANEARNRGRSSRRHAALALRLSAAAAAEGPEEAAVADDQRRRLLDALRDLNDRDRLVVAYRYFAEMSEQEMAAAMGCSPGTVKSRLSRALGRLRDTLVLEGSDAG